MSRYILNDNTMVKIAETYGTMENISDYRAQVYTGADVDEGIILYPRHRLSFNQELWVARMTGEVGTVVIAVLPYITSGDGSGGIGTGTSTGDGVSINVNNCDCGCCSGTGTSIATVPSGTGGSGTDITVSSDCTCCPSVVIPAGACNCSGGELKFTFPIVVNVNAPQTINVPTSGGTGTSTGTDDGDDEDSGLTFEELSDVYFSSKQPDGSYTLPSAYSGGSNYDFEKAMNKYFAEKEE